MSKALAVPGYDSIQFSVENDLDNNATKIVAMFSYYAVVRVNNEVFKAGNAADILADHIPRLVATLSDGISKELEKLKLG